MRILFGLYGIPKQGCPITALSYFRSSSLWDVIASNTPGVPSTNAYGLAEWGSFKLSNELYKQVNRVEDHSIRGWSIFCTAIIPHHTQPLIGPLAVYFWSENSTPVWDLTVLLRWERSKQHRNWATILMLSYVSTKLLWQETMVVILTGNLQYWWRERILYSTQYNLILV